MEGGRWVSPEDDVAVSYQNVVEDVMQWRDVVVLADSDSDANTRNSSPSENKPALAPSESSLQKYKRFTRRKHSKSDDAIHRARARSRSNERKPKIQIFGKEELRNGRLFDIMHEKAAEIGNLKTDDVPICSVYITACKANVKFNSNGRLTMDKLAKAIEDMLVGKAKIQQTACGFVLEFTKEEDLERTLKLQMTQIFGYPVIVWKFPISYAKYKRTVIVKDIPWCIPVAEVQKALKCQGICPGRISRKSGAIRVDVSNSCDLERLLKEGLNFFNCGHFPVGLEGNHGNEPDIIQCYRCQRFWHTAVHCRYPVRCVRCGEAHDVCNCTRLRTDAVCCLCGGAHHAAHKMCPIRQEHISSMEVDFSLSKTKPTKRLSR